MHRILQKPLRRRDFCSADPIARIPMKQLFILARSNKLFLEIGFIS